MANTDNECYEIKIEDYYTDSQSHLKDMLDLQAKTQEMYFNKQGNPQFKEMTLKELSNFFLMNKHALEDELGEIMDALGGIHDGIGNAVWKPWKADNTKTKDMTIADLSERDLVELKFEIIDAWHFLMNMWVAVDGTPEEFYNYYINKNKANWERQQKGY